MLSMIKDMINKKTAYLEAANVIFEDVSGENLDDLIILGQDPITEAEEYDDRKEEFDETDEKDSEGNDNDQKDDEEDILDTPAEDTPEEGPSEDHPDEDILDQDVDAPEPESDPAAINGSLPTPVGAQTGDVIDPLDDIMNVELDMGSNTLKDVLPVPPTNAADAVSGGGDDILDQRIDSGFGGDEPAPESTPPIEPGGPAGENDILDEEVGDGDDDLLSEAISIGGDPTANSDDTADTPVDGDTPADTPAEDAPTDGENDVTAAVRDKVAEADEPMEDTTGGTGSGAKDELLKKLGSITKSLEDAKKAVMQSMSN